MPWRRARHPDTLLLLTWLTLAAGLAHLALGVRITQLKVPRLVQNGSDVSLDCEFQLEPHESRHLELVVKWYWNGQPEPVYQWIPAHGRPQDLGPLRGRLDLSYPANRSGAGGIRIVGATTDLTGDYKCAVSTYDGEDFMIKKMIVFAPESNMFLQYGRPAEDSFNVSCMAEGVYPEPRMSLFYSRPDVRDKAMTKSASRCDTQIREYPMEGVTVETGRRGNSFTIRATSSEVQDLQHLPGAILFVCELRVPEAEYCQRRAILYLPGEEEPPSDAEGEQGAAAGRSLLASAAVICVSIAVISVCK